MNNTLWTIVAILFIIVLGAMAINILGN